MLFSCGTLGGGSGRNNISPSLGVARGGRRVGLGAGGGGGEHIIINNSHTRLRLAGAARFGAWMFQRGFEDLSCGG